MNRSLSSGITRTHFRSEIFLLISVVCFVQAILVGVTIWNVYSKRLFNVEKENLTQLLNVVNQDLDSRIEAIASIALDLVINTEIKNGLNKTDYLELGRAKAIINSILSKKFLSASNELLDISIIDRERNAYSTRAIYFLPENFSLYDTDVFKQAEEFNGALRWMNNNSLIDRYSGDSMFPNTPMGGLRSAALIKDYSRGETLGLLMISIKNDFFSSIDYSNNKLEKVGMFLLSPDRTVMLPVAGSVGNIKEDIVRRIDTSMPRGVFMMEDTEKTLVSYIKNEAMGWTLVSTAFSADIRRSFSFIGRTLLLALLFSLIASTLISWWSSKYLTKGISDLAAMMREVEKGRFDVQIKSKKNDEIAWLSGVFDHMVYQIKDLVEKTYTQKLLTQQAEFRALQAQINPHFLYNTLDMFKWRLLNKGEMEISQSIVELGRILQYTMSAQETVFLKDEIQNVKDYVALRQSNKDPEFDCRIEINGGDEVVLPKLTLQPLIENAIIHGFYGRRFKNRLCVYGSPFGNDLYRISIEDNGIGIGEEKLRSILSEKSSVSDTEHETETRIGIHNVMERLKLILGNTCSLSITSDFGSGTCVFIVVPRPNPVSSNISARNGQCAS